MQAKFVLHLLERIIQLNFQTLAFPNANALKLNQSPSICRILGIAKAQLVQYPVSNSGQHQMLQSKMQATQQ